MATRIKSLGWFTARSADGREFAINATQEFIENTGLDGVAHSSPGMKSLETRDSHAVTRIAQGRYLIVPLGLNVQSDSPNAP